MSRWSVVQSSRFSWGMLTFAAAMLFAVAPLHAATKYTHKVLKSFCSGCADGDFPNGLLEDASGNLYGTTEVGGGGVDGYEGVAYELTPNRGKTKYTETVLYTFCKKANCADGAYPDSDLIIDTSGNLYGTASQGGKYGGGVIFELASAGNGWTYTILHSFCQGNCSGGSDPETGLSYAGQWQGKRWDASSPLFGTANKGGSGNGVIYELSPHPYEYKVIHKLQTGTYPQPVLVDSNSNLIVTDSEGGEYGGGVLFRLAANTWSETTLHNFCDQANCTDGDGPYGRPLIDAAGNIYLTTSIGGASNNGTVFERPSAGGFNVLYSFCSLTGCADGYNPIAGLAMDGSGNLFGTTEAGGAESSGGVVFELSSSGVMTVLFKFCASGGNCTGGAYPEAGVLLDSAGNIFGTTNGGGYYEEGGTVFVLKP